MPSNERRNFSFLTSHSADTDGKNPHQGNVYRGEFKNQEYLGNVSLDYAHTWNAHTLSAGISTEYHYQEHTAFWTRAKGITTNDFGYDNIGATSSRPYGGTGSTYDDMSLASVMANASYTLYNKYKLTLTMRGDGSSMYAHSRAIRCRDIPDS